MNLNERLYQIKRTHEKHINPKISVIVPVYKVEKYLTHCLNSIVNQTMEELEIIIVDEGDQDRCREIIDYFESQDPRIIAPHQKNGGYGASWNLGFSLARGEYIATVESDDFIEPEMFEEMYAYAKALDADIVKTPYYEYFDGRGRNDCNFRQWFAETCPKNNVFTIVEFPQLLGVHPALWSAIYRTDMMREYDVKCIAAKGAGYIDNPFRLESFMAAKRIAWLDKPYYNYRLTNENASTQNNYNLNAMLERWSGMHDLLKQYPQELIDRFMPYLVKEEWHNCFSCIFSKEITLKQWEFMRENAQFIEEKHIQNSEVLTEFERNVIRGVKKGNMPLGCNLRPSSFLRKHKDTVLEVMNKLSNPILLYWFFAGFVCCTFMSLIAAVVFNHIQVAYILAGCSYIMTFGILCCFVAKFFRKVLKKTLDQYRKRKERVK